MTTILTIPEKVPSNNGRNGLIRMHWTKRRKKVDDWVWLFRAQTQNRHTTPVTIEITHYYVGAPISDYDNLVSACKLIFDALKKAGVIVDDHQAITGVPVLNQVRVKKKSEVKSIIKITSRNHKA